MTTARVLPPYICPDIDRGIPQPYVSVNTKDTGEGKIGHSAAARETGSTACAKHSGHSVGKTTQCCQWQSLSITCCSRLISGVSVIRGYLKDASHKNKRPIRLYVVCNSVNCTDQVKMGFHNGPIGCHIIHNVRTI